jgi:hypothetical protein
MVRSSTTGIFSTTLEHNFHNIKTRKVPAVIDQFEPRPFVVWLVYTLSYRIEMTTVTRCELFANFV